jgi:hypothetical protein
MRLRLIAATFAVLFSCAAPASASTIFVFSLSDGSATDPGSISSFSFEPLGLGGTLSVLKELDAFSPLVLSATATGTVYPGATLTAYDTVITPGSRLFEYALTNAIFTSVQMVGEPTHPLESFSIFGATVTVTRGPAAAPEPGMLLLIATGAGLALRRHRQITERAKRV